MDGQASTQGNTTRPFCDGYCDIKWGDVSDYGFCSTEYMRREVVHIDNEFNNDMHERLAEVKRFLQTFVSAMPSGSSGDVRGSHDAPLLDIHQFILNLLTTDIKTVAGNCVIIATSLIEADISDVRTTLIGSMTTLA
jgi:hypothetical protein